MTPESLQVLRDFAETKMAPSLPMLRKAVAEILEEHTSLLDQLDAIDDMREFCSKE